jgi:hypothetical protein
VVSRRIYIRFDLNVASGVGVGGNYDYDGDGRYEKPGNGARRPRGRGLFSLQTAAIVDRTMESRVPQTSGRQYN